MVDPQRDIMRLIVTALAVFCLACAGPLVAKSRGSSHSSHAAPAYKSASSHASPSPTKRSTSRVSIPHPSTANRATQPKASASQPRHSTKAQGVQRDSKSKIARDPAQRAKFERSHPCPSTGKRSGACPGYVVDHVRPLKRGEADRPENMQWQTTAAAKQKDKTE